VAGSGSGGGLSGAAGDFIFPGDEVEEGFGGVEAADGFEDVGDAFVGEESLELEGFFVIGVVVAEGGDDAVEEVEGFDSVLEG